MNTINVNTKESRSQMTEKWRKTGLLDELDESKAADCAESLEIMAKLLVEEYGKNGYSAKANNLDGVKCDIDTLYSENGGWFAGVALPIVRRMYSENVAVPDSKWLYEDLKSFLTSKHQLFKDMKECSIAGDTEAEMCELYVKDIVARLS
jgi:hypothetical protein